MGVVIAAVGTAYPDNLLSHGARRLADAAVRDCLEHSPYRASDLDLLVNAGVYRERGLGEPALAALVQQDVHANDHSPQHGGHGTFSFDIDNGACGILTGVDLVRGLLCSGAARVGLVVASDSGANPVQARHMPYSEYGGAMVLDRDEVTEGFVDVRFRTFPEYAELAEGYWTWVPRRGRRPGRRAGRNKLLVVERPGFRERATVCAAEVVRDLLTANDVRVSDIDLLIATPQPRFATPLADVLGLPHTRLVHIDERAARSHSAQPVVAVATAMRNGDWARARTILFVSAGAGITVGAALYRH
jgi:3-oxoacyl-[acyl-carrier-protein] synthase III